MITSRKPVLLVIRDGWGKNPDASQNATNAVVLAQKPCDDMLHATYPCTLVRASGLDVGLPDGVMGNSEVGHENIGAGRIVDQELVRLNKLFSEKRLVTNAVWRAAIDRVKTRPGARLHLMGIVSDAGVHGMLEHLYGILRQAKEDGLTANQVFIHAFTDGRDTPPSSGLGYVQQVDAQCRAIGIGAIASVCGRFWAMDRDNRWERVSKAYNMLIGKFAATTAPSAAAAVQAYYDQPLNASQKGDEFIPPTWVAGTDGKRLATAGADVTRVWDMESGIELMATNIYGGGTPAFSPDGRKLALGCWDGASSGVWDIDTRRLLFRLPHSNYSKGGP